MTNNKNPILHIKIKDNFLKYYLLALKYYNFKKFLISYCKIINN